MLPSIRGTTDVFLIPGDPVEQVRAPEVFNLVFKSLGINAVLVPVHVAAGDIENFVRTAFLARNIKGMFLAIPHKSLVMGLLARSNEEGRVAGAVNGIRRHADGQLEGGLFDGIGFVSSLDYFGVAYAGKRVLVLGAGGGASAIAASLALAGSRAPAEIALFDPVPGKAQAVASHIAAAVHAAGTSVLAAAGNDPFGLTQFGVNLTRLAPHAAVFDILMKNQPTPLVRAARARKLVAQPGFEMLIQQTPLYLDFFGFHDAAAAVRRDATFLRECIYPKELHGEIRRAAPVPVPTP